MQASEEGARGWKARVGAFRNVPALLKLVWATSPWLAIICLATRVILAFFPVGQLYIATLILTRIVESLTGRPHHGLNVWQLVVCEIVSVVLYEFIGRAVTLADSLLGDQFTNSANLKLMRHALALDLSAFEDAQFYDKLERARRQTASRLAMVATIATMLQQFVTLLVFSASLTLFAPWLLPLLAIAVIPAFLGESHFAMLSYSLLFRSTPGRRQLEYLRLLAASSSTVKEIKIFGLGDYLVSQSSRLFDRFYRENKAIAVRRAVVGSALSIVPTLGYYAAYAYLVKRAMNREIAIGAFTFLAASFTRCRGLMESLFSSLASVAEGAAQLNDLFDFFKARPTITCNPGALAAPRPMRRGFEFRGVSFVYPGTTNPVLLNLNFRLDAGERIALVGENGSGKTTLVKLLTRLYDPSDGVILLDGVDLREYDPEDLRREVGVIFQDYVRYDASASDNIGYGRIQNLNDTAAIMFAARKSLACDVIEKLPDSYDQLLGRRFEGGIDLSGGQWQKIALARAYMRDAQLLILDEPTASLDPRAEYEVFQRFADLTIGKMAILISHRFSTVRMADRIAVMEDGQLLEQGSHDELVRKRGRYAELFELQAQGYR